MDQQVHLQSVHIPLADSMVTNYAPMSTLMMMTSAFTGHELLKEAYATAIKEKYRFLTYGDAMLII